MNPSAVGRPLSPYLQKLVDQGSLIEEVAQVVNQMPDWKEQQEAVKEWKSRLPELAYEVSTEVEKTRAISSEGYLDSLDFLLDYNAIHVKTPYYYLETNLEEYLDYLRWLISLILFQTHVIPFRANTASAATADVLD
jgi:hypothetical protein